LFMVALAVQAGLLIFLQGQKQWEISHGHRIVVSAQPVDPSDVFRGDYVVLRYGFSRVPRALLGQVPEESLRGGKTVYLRLEPEPKGPAGWKASALALQPGKTLAPTAVMLRGEVKWSTDQELDLVFGCENFFVPQGRGQDLETAMREHKLAVALAITPAGQAYATQLLIDGEPVKF